VDYYKLAEERQSEVNRLLTGQNNNDDSLSEIAEFMRTRLLPQLSALYDAVNAKFDNCLSGLFVLRNPETGNCLTKSYKYYRSMYVLEVYCEFDKESYDEVSDAWNYIIDELDSNRRNYKAYAYMYLNGTKEYSNLFLLHRKRDDGFCVRSKQTDKALSENNYLTIKGIFDSFNDEMALQHLTHTYPYYSWEMKRNCLFEEPIRYSHLDQKDYVLFAALAHKFANDSYLEVPSWVFDAYYTYPEPYQYGYNYDIPEEFRHHNLVANMVDFINV